jgi:hypothetical protein
LTPVIIKGRSLKIFTELYGHDGLRLQVNGDRNLLTPSGALRTPSAWLMADRLTVSKKLEENRGNWDRERKRVDGGVGGKSSRAPLGPKPGRGCAGLCLYLIKKVCPDW